MGHLARRAFSAADITSPTILRLALAAFLCTAATSGPAETLTPIGLLPGGTYRNAFAISGDGSAVTGYGNSSTYITEAFRWTPGGGNQGLGVVPGGSYVVSYGNGISADGTAVVGRLATGTTSQIGLEAFRWTDSGGMFGLGFLGGGVTSQATGVSANGAVVVGFGTSSGQPNGEAFRWTETGGMTGLGSLPGGQFSLATGVSGDGSAVVGRSVTATNSDEQAFRWTESSGMLGLGFLPGGGYRSNAAGVSADGSVIVGSGGVRNVNPALPGRTEAFRWTATDGMVGLGVLPGKSGSEATGVSADGSVIIGLSSGGGDAAFIWTAEAGMRSLLDVLVAGGATDLAGWTFTNALAISADGRHVLVSASNQPGQIGQYVAHLVPLPPAIYLFGSALAGLATRRWATGR